MSGTYGQLASDVQKEVHEFEQKMQRTLEEFKQQTGLPVYVMVEDVKNETIGGQSPVHQQIRAKVVF